MPEFLTRSDRKRIESFHKIDVDVVLGEVKIDHDNCKGCGLCVGSCAASALELTGERKARKSRMVDELPFCMSCGDCVAICPEQAIELTRFLQFKRAFRYLDRGEPHPPRRF
jgi:ferredoxin